jgi:hypothetical protein
VSKPEDRRAGPMVNGNPWAARVFQVVDNFDRTRKRYVGHRRARYQSSPDERRLPSWANGSKRPDAAEGAGSRQDPSWPRAHTVRMTL